MDWGLQIGSVYFTSIDIIVFSLCMLGGIIGTISGFARSFASSAGYIAGFLVALMFTTRLAELFMENFASLSPFWATFIVFIGLFIIGYGLLRWVGSLLEHAMDAIGISVVNSLLGFFWGVIESIIIISVVIYILSLQNVFDLSPWFNQSQIVSHLIQPFIPVSIDYLSGLA